MNRILVKLFIISLVSICSGEVTATTYRIIKLWNCKSIKIGNKQMKEGDRFDSETYIYWTHASQMITVEDLGGKNYKKLTKREFDKHQAHSLEELLVKEKTLGSRSLLDDIDSDKEYYLTDNDTLHFAVLDIPKKKTIAEAIWVYDGKKIISEIQKTPDKKFFVISLSIFNNYKPHDVLLDIRERTPNSNWIDNVYADIPIIYIPSK